MKWSEALQALLDDVLADDALIEALDGEHVYRDGEHSEPRIPGVYFSVLNAGLDETSAPLLTQWDIFAPDIDTALAIEARLQAKLLWVGWRTIAGISMASDPDDHESRDHPEPDFDVIHRSLDFRHTPVRNRGW